MAPEAALILSGLKKRKEFLLVAQGKKASGRFLSLQMRAQPSKSEALGQNKMPSKSEASGHQKKIGEPACVAGGVCEAAPNAKQKKEIRFGLTASKKVGNAVKRNRARRRLREALKQCLPLYGLLGHDYVAIARPQTIDAKWQELLEDIIHLLKRLSSSKTKAINPQKP